MPDATAQQIAEFKRRYCHNDDSRRQIAECFDVAIESHEELLPGFTVQSYATGSRPIDGAFVVFRVTDIKNDIVYFPVFSETVSRDLVRAWNLELPRKMSIFAGENQPGGAGGEHHVGIRRNSENRQMLLLIQFARSMMILHTDDPKPMNGPFKAIYEKLYSNPSHGVESWQIKSVNTATKKYLESRFNKKRENFQNLQDYIGFVRDKYPHKKIRAFNFERLRAMMRERYPDECIVF